MRYFSFRSKHRSIGYLIIGLICFYLIYLIYNLNNDLEEIDEITSCELTSETIDELKELSITLRDLFDSLNLKYFLCYQTLFGAIKNNRPLDWHSNLDFCILNHQLNNQDETFIFRQFLNKKLTLRYSTKYGFYKVNSVKSNKVHAKIYVFEKDLHLKVYRRIGLKYRIITPDQCSRLNCFPDHLVDENPLPLIRFIEDTFSVPLEKEEILKYLMPDSWHELDRLPEKCKKV